jgi:hypothetical protein
MIWFNHRRMASVGETGRSYLLSRLAALSQVQAFVNKRATTFSTVFSLAIIANFLASDSRVGMHI